MRLLLKFSLIFFVVFGLGVAASGWLLREHLQRNAREQVLYDARLLMETALAVRSYTLEQITPALGSTVSMATSMDPKAAQAAADDDPFRQLCTKHGYGNAPAVFHPQTVPAFAATEMFLQLRKAYPDYAYKEATLNPTNPRDKAVAWEEDIINVFKHHPELEQFDGQRTTPFGPALYLARPLRSPRACLVCHSTPDAAPPEMIQRYGPSNGFGWGENDVIGAQVVSVPVALPVQAADRALRQLLLSFGAVGAAALVVLNLLLYAMVVRPVSRMARRADEISRGQLDVPELPARGHDEISILAAAFNRMHLSLVTAMKLLEGEKPAEADDPSTPDLGD